MGKEKNEVKSGVKIGRHFREDVRNVVAEALANSIIVDEKNPVSMEGKNKDFDIYMGENIKFDRGVIVITTLSLHDKRTLTVVDRGIAVRSS